MPGKRFGRRAPILGPNVKKAVLAVARWRCTFAGENPHLTRVVSRQKMLESVPAPANSHHHVSSLEKLRTNRTPRSLATSRLHGFFTYFFFSFFFQTLELSIVFLSLRLSTLKQEIGRFGCDEISR